MDRKIKKIAAERQTNQAKLELAPGKPPRMASKPYINFYAKAMLGVLR